MAHISELADIPATGIDLSRPWGELSEAGRRAVLYGCGEEEFDVVWDYEGAEGEDLTIRLRIM